MDDLLGSASCQGHVQRVEHQRCADAIDHPTTRRLTSRMARYKNPDSDRSALAFRTMGFSGPPSEPDVRLSPHPLSMCSCRRNACPRRRDPRAPESVALNGHRVGTKQLNVVRADHPTREKASHQGVQARDEPADDSDEVVDVLKVRRHPVPEVVAPAPQHRVERRSSAASVPCTAGAYGDDRGECLLRWVGVDRFPAMLPPTRRWTRQPRKSNPSSQTLVFSSDRRRPIGASTVAIEPSASSRVPLTRTTKSSAYERASSPLRRGGAAGPFRTPTSKVHDKAILASAERIPP